MAAKQLIQYLTGNGRAGEEIEGETGISVSGGCFCVGDGGIVQRYMHGMYPSATAHIVMMRPAS